MGKNLIFLTNKVLQQDMRIRLPKAILEIMKATNGKTVFDIYYDTNNEAIVLKKHEEE